MFPATKFPLVYLISAGTTTDENFTANSLRFLELARVAVKSKVSLIQIREKQLSPRNVYELTRQAFAITKNSETLLLVNDRADLAFAANADGVHLTASSLPASIIRQNFPAEFIIGVSAHSLEDVQQAKTEGADFAAFSPIFHSPHKGEPQGLEKLREVCAAAKDFPVIALGGIDETNFAETFKAGASGIAAIRLLNDAKTLPQIVKSIRNE